MAANPPQPWPGSDDRQVVNEMLNDPNSPHWGKCRNYIASYLQKLGVPIEHLDDVTQNTLESVFDNLKSFEFRGRFRAWLHRVAWSRKMDWLRDKARQKPPNSYIGSLSDIDPEDDAKVAEAIPTTEENYLRDETLREIRKNLEDYAKLQKDPERIRNIFQKAFYEDVTRKDIAEPLDISPARVSQIIQDGFSYVRKKMGRGPDFDPPRAS